MKLLGVISMAINIAELEKDGGMMRQYISYTKTLRNPLIQLVGKYCTILNMQ
jgi:hypothetical protein